MPEKFVRGFIIVTIVLLYITTSVISSLHVIDFFKLSNPDWLAISLAVAFEIGSAASLASLLMLDKINKTLMWFLFTVLTLVQINGNLYYAYIHLKDFQAWSQLFNLVDDDVMFQKRVLSIVSGAILPLISMGFIKGLVDYIKPTKVSEVPTMVESQPEAPKIISEIKIDNPSIQEKVEIEKKDEPIQEMVQSEPELLDIKPEEKPETPRTSESVIDRIKFYK